MEPFTIITSAILNQFQTGQFIGSLVAGILGNRADVLLCNSTNKFYEKLVFEVDEPLNHDVQRAVRKSYLSATLLAVKHIKKRYKWNDGNNSEDIISIHKYVQKELRLLETGKIRFQETDFDKEYRKLMSSSGVNASDRISDMVFSLKESLFLELRKSGLRVELELKQIILHGWENSFKKVDWYKLVCAFFNEELKVNPRLSSFIQTGFLNDMNSEIAEVNFKVSELTQKLDSISLDYKSFVSVLNSILDKSDKIEEIVLKTDETTREIKESISEIKEKFGSSDIIGKKGDEGKIGLSTFTDENLLNIINFFEKKTRNNDLTDSELVDLIDTQSKLYDSIFKNFDDQLDTKYKDRVAGAIFDRIITFQKIQKTDFDRIQKIRYNTTYSSVDRSLIVSGLTVSLLNSFDDLKLNLLIDFLTDFEEEVWQKALVGLIICLYRFDNKLNLFPEINKRLHKLKKVDEVQAGIILVERILHLKTYSAKFIFKDNRKYFISVLQRIFGSQIQLQKSEFSFLQNVLENKSQYHDYEILNKLIIKEKLTDFYTKYSDHDSFTVDFEEYFDCLDFETYMRLYELNPFQFKLDSEIFSEPRNWFIPFKDNKKIRNTLIENFEIPDLDILDFLESIESSNALSEIDKHYIIVNIKSFSEDFLNGIFFLTKNEKDIFFGSNPSRTEVLLTKTIREIYRFQQLSIIPECKNIFDEKLTIYNKSLLDKMADELTKVKIKAKHFYEADLYEKSIKVLEEYKTKVKDKEVLELLALNHFELENYKESLIHIKKILALSNKKASASSRIYWFSKAASASFNLEDFENYEKYSIQKTSLRETILNESIVHNQPEVLKKTALLLSSDYNSLSIHFWNQNKDIQKSFFFHIKYIQVILEIPTLDKKEVQSQLQSNKESSTVLFDLFTDNKEIIDSVKTNLQYLEKNGINLPSVKIFKFLIAIKRLKELASKERVYNNLKKNKKVQELISNHFTAMKPVLENVKKGENKYERVVVPFGVKNDKTINLVFDLKEFFNGEEDYVLQVFSKDLLEGVRNEIYKKMVDKFLDNVLSQENTFDYRISLIPEFKSYLLSSKLPTDNKESK